LFNESNTRATCDISAEVVELRLLVEVRERTLAECFDQLVKMRDDLEMKDHQFALKDWQLVLRDHQVANLEAYLVRVHKSRQRESAGVHFDIRLYLKEEEKCWKLHKKYRLWKSWALEKHGVSGESSWEQHLG
jgi:hypothetical protein